MKRFNSGAIIWYIDPHNDRVNTGAIDNIPLYQYPHHRCRGCHGGDFTWHLIQQLGASAGAGGQVDPKLGDRNGDIYII